MISSNGSSGGYGSEAGGGGSGGGSINIFYKNNITKGNLAVNAGAYGTTAGASSHGGQGGDGSITIGNISTGTFVED